MIYVITSTGVYSSDSLKKINDKLNASIEPDELHYFGADQVVNMTAADLDFVQDKRKLSKIMFGNFFVKDNSAKIFGILNAVLIILVLVLK
jgi:quinol-cytochrome oxidoreductase complex cytochrome b subunit